ncbi:DoxX family membrane protein [Variovorax terrae]|uniref:DoxX family membrane protein n=1 Tax=Variovorax terrae TaxID=2923278 RepID=A0A9X1VYA0_9BURK|nr:DoxX family membrane protein [Variovorax terrae]MCJ0764369.1 DoxX family membrane protein [Variovorax terrae]
MQAVLTAPWMHTLLLLCLCAPYLQGAVLKLLDFRGAVAEVSGLGLAPAAPLAAATAALQVVAPALILSGWHRWLGALLLAAFTLLAAVLAHRFWQTSGAKRRRLGIAFCEHGALAGGLLLVVWQDLGGRHA